MDAKQAIMDILAIYEENTQLQSDLKQLKDENNALKSRVLKTSPLEQYGHDQLLKEILHSWQLSDVGLTLNDDGSITFRSFDLWLERALYTDNIPSYMSKDQVLKLFDKDFHRIYEENIQKAKDEYTAKLLKEEQTAKGVVEESK